MQRASARVTLIVAVTVGAVAPSILAHPDDASILVGGSTTFTAQASGTATLTYQWQFSDNGGTSYADIPDATATSYLLSDAQLAHAGLYRLAVTNSLGTAHSNPAALTVNQTPSITHPPVDATLSIGDPLELSVTALGTLGSRIQEAHARLREMSTEQVEQRVARAILRLASQAGRRVEQGVEIECPLTRQDIAEMTGTTLHTVSRILSRWEQEGTVASGRQRITIRKPHALVSGDEVRLGETTLKFVLSQ